MIVKMLRRGKNCIQILNRSTDPFRGTCSPFTRFYSQKLETQLNTETGLLLSDSCVRRLKQLCDGNNTFLRLSVEGGGCSGFQYKFNIDETIKDDDRIFERDGVKLVIDDVSLEYVKGSTVEFHTELIRSAFRIAKNPNAEVGCSCGASFAIKLD